MWWFGGNGFGGLELDYLFDMIGLISVMYFVGNFQWDFFLFGQLIFKVQVGLVVKVWFCKEQVWFYNWVLEC